MSGIRIGIIGIGVMGKKYARWLASGVVSGAQLSAVCCRSAASSSWACEHLPGDVRVFRSTGEMFGHPEVYDAVLIATPHRLHREQAIRAMELGKHVLCEKPAAVTARDAREMAETAEEKEILYGIMFHQRYYEKYQRVKELLAGGTVGEIRRIQLENSRYFRTAAYHASGGWRSSWNGEGGGLLINQAQHVLDIWQWLFGMPDSLYAHISFGKYNEFAVDDEDILIMRYKDKMTGTGPTPKQRNTERLQN